MDAIVRLWETTWITGEGLVAVVVLLAFALLLCGLTVRARRRPFSIRPLLAAERMRAAVAQAMETGEELHVALGTGGLGDLSTADTLAGLYLVSHLAHRAALAEIPLHVQVADPTALVGALAALQHGALGAGHAQARDRMQAEFVAPAPIPYAVGVAQALCREPIVVNAMVGSFGPEVLLPGEAGMARGLNQVGGTSSPTTLPLLAATVAAPLLGEEIFALGAALGRGEHTGSLAAQDVFRVLLAGSILALAIVGLLRL